MHINSQLKFLSKEFTKKAFALILVFLVIRIGEHLAINLIHDFEVAVYHQLFLSSILSDLFFVLHFTLILLPIYFLIGYFKLKVANVFFYATTGLIILTNFLLTEYFFKTLTLLDASIFRFSFSEIAFIIGTETNFADPYFYLFFILLAASIYLLYFLSKKIKVNLLAQQILYGFILLSFIFSSYNYYPHKAFNDRLSHDIATNKLIYLYRNNLELNKIENESSDFSQINSDINKYQSIHSEFEFINSDYPLFHKSRTTNEFADLFELDTEKNPNLVFIFSESLSRTFSGPNSRYSSFTPFIDSLSNNSLYFENFLSNADRTFGVFTNVLASLPNANSKGIINLGNEIPNHNSIIKVLNKNGYTSNFFFGGWGNFDNMKTYFANQNTSNIYTDKDFPDRYKKYVKWGFSDEDLFKRSLELLNKKKNPNPYINVYMTTSLHSPWKVPDNRKVEIDQLYTRLLNQSNKQFKGFYKDYAPQLKTSLYADKSLKLFFESYKKRPEFNNTIFIIVGDHNIRAMKPKNYLEFYHVPLIIYSPMLKNSKVYSAVSTHRDIAPSILSLVENNRQIKTSTNTSWLSDGLDLNEKYRCKQKTTLSTLSGETGYIENNLLYFNDQLFKIEPNFELKKIINKDKELELKKNFENHKKVYNYVINTNRITPPVN